MRIDFKLFDLGTDRLQFAVAHYMVFNSSHFIYHIECHVTTEPNIKEGEFEPKENYICYSGIFKKDQIAGIELSFSQSDYGEKYDVWTVEINVGLPGSNLRPKFETRTEAEEFYKQAIEYYINK